MTHKKPTVGYLYVVATQSGTVKFGISKTPKTRIKAHRYSLGRISPIVYEWTSRACGGYKEVESRIICLYGGEYVSSGSPGEIKEQIEKFINEWDSENPEYYEDKTLPGNSIFVEDKSRSELPSETMARAAFVLDHSDNDLRAYFLVPVLCAHAGIPHLGMPNSVRESIANAICVLDDVGLAEFLAAFFSGGLRQDAAMKHVGLTKEKFKFEVAQ